MNEKKFSKKLNDMTAQERKRKDDIWEDISREAGFNCQKTKGISLRFAMSVVMCVFVSCVAIPIAIVILSKPISQAVVGNSSSSSGLVSVPSSADDPNKFNDNEYYYVYSPKTIAELAKEDNNILYVNDWQREERGLSLMKDRKDSERVIGLRDKAEDTVNKCQISVNILYENINVVSMNNIINNMKDKDNKQTVKGTDIDVYWQSGDKDSYATFKYNNYTYLIQVHGNSSGIAALNAAKTLLETKHN